MIDTNIHLGTWPFRRLPLGDTGALVERLKSLGVRQAWAGSFEAVFHRDLSGANERLAAECRSVADGFLLPFGSVNPKLPDWREDLRRLHETQKLSGVRLFPGYHGYKLDDPEFGALLAAAHERKLPVQVAVKLEDERTQHPLMPVPGVDVAPLVPLIQKLPMLRLQVLNLSGVIADAVLIPLARSGRVAFDFAMVEGVGGVAAFAERVGLERVFFGSHAPFFAAESSHLKLRESSFSDAEREAIRRGNAETWIV